jgi:anti-anti-sigma factor
VAFEVRETKLVTGFVVLEPVGRLESKTSPELDKKVVALLGAGERRFVVDLSATEYVSSAGLRVLLMLAKKVSGGAGRLALCGLNPQIREVFDIAGLGALFQIRETRDEALAAAESAPAERSRSVSMPAPKAAAQPELASPAEDPLLARVVAALGPVGPPHDAGASDAGVVARAAAALLGAP